MHIYPFQILQILAKSSQFLRLKILARKRIRKVPMSNLA